SRRNHYNRFRLQTPDIPFLPIYSNAEDAERTPDGCFPLRQATEHSGFAHVFSQTDHRQRPYRALIHDLVIGGFSRIRRFFRSKSPRRSSRESTLGSKLIRSSAIKEARPTFFPSAAWQYSQFSESCS